MAPSSILLQRPQYHRPLTEVAWQYCDEWSWLLLGMLLEPRVFRRITDALTRARFFNRVLQQSQYCRRTLLLALDSASFSSYSSTSPTTQAVVSWGSRPSSVRLSDTSMVRPCGREAGVCEKLVRQVSSAGLESTSASRV